MALRDRLVPPRHSPLTIKRGQPFSSFTPNALEHFLSHRSLPQSLPPSLPLRKMSQKASRHQRKPSQSVFVFPDSFDNVVVDKIAPSSNQVLPPPEISVPLYPPGASPPALSPEKVVRDASIEKDDGLATKK